MDLLTILAEVIQDTPEIVSAIKAALQKKGYTNEQIDAIFAPVVPRDELGIDPSHPFADDSGSGAAAEPQPKVTSVPSATAPPVPAETAKPAPPAPPAHIFAR